MQFALTLVLVISVRNVCFAVAFIENKPELKNISRGISQYSEFNDKCQVLTDNSCDMRCESVFQHDINDLITEFWMTNTMNCRVNGLRLTLLDAIFSDSLIQFDISTDTTIRVVGLTITFTKQKEVILNANAFAATLFQGIELLTIDNIYTRLIRSDVFAHVTNLMHFTITRSNILKFESGSMDGLGQTLRRFEYDSLQGPRDLVDMTGNSTMVRLAEVVIFVNLADTINQTTFAGLTFVNTLTLARCQITSIGANSFDSIAKTIRKLDLSNNQLITLPDNIFEQIGNSALDRAILLERNLWHCDCRLIPLARLLIIRNLITEFECNTPSCLESSPMDNIEYCVQNDSNPCRPTMGETANDGVWIRDEDKLMVCSVAVTLAVIIFLLSWSLSWVVAKGYICQSMANDWRKHSTSTATGGSEDTLERRTSSLTTVSAKSFGMNQCAYDEKLKEYETPVTNHYTSLYAQPLPPLPPPNAPLPRRIEYEEGSPDDYYCSVK